MKPSSIKPLFYISALFNWMIAVSMFLRPQRVYELFLYGPLPATYAFVYLFAALVFLFGIGYLWVALSFYKNRPIVGLGALGKFFMFLVAFVLVVILGEAKPLLLFTGIADLMFAILFFLTLRVPPDAFSRG